MIRYHIDRIKCPECGKIQPAKVVHGLPFNIYSHCCKKCGYIITESEWNITEEKIIKRNIKKVKETEKNKDFGCEYCANKCGCYHNHLKEKFKRTMAQYDKVVEQNRSLQTELLPFRQEYFRALDTATIAALAKKSIKITALNIEAEDLIEHIYHTIDNAGEANALRIIKQSIKKYRGRYSG